MITCITNNAETPIEWYIHNFTALRLPSRNILIRLLIAFYLSLESAAAAVSSFFIITKLMTMEYMSLPTTITTVMLAMMLTLTIITISYGDDVTLSTVTVFVMK